VEKLPTKNLTGYRAYVTKGLGSVEYLDLGSFKAGATEFMRR
jgi:hypothetical protein